jgi:hypothetical protein
MAIFVTDSFLLGFAVAPTETADLCPIFPDFIPRSAKQDLQLA